MFDMYYFRYVKYVRYLIIFQIFDDVNVNVTDTILWQGYHDRVMQLN